MSRELEIEFKNMLIRQECDKLCHHFNVHSHDFSCQHNHYFDTPSLMLREKGCALRIRKKSGNVTLTLKQPHSDGLLEIHQPLTDQQTETAISNHGLPDGEVSTAIQSLDLTPSTLQYLGSLTTMRAEVPYRNGTLVIDHSEYLQTEDDELEYEADEQQSGEKNFEHLLTAFNIPRRQTKNKIQRFFDAKSHQ